MDKSVVVYKNRTNVLTVRLGIDVSGDTFESEIRDRPNSDANLIATWAFSFLTDGTDGVVVLTCDNSQLSNVVHKTGYMDLKRVSNGEPYQVYAPVKVQFVDTVTA
jgi:broad-specificity NMP kinase